MLRYCKKCRQYVEAARDSFTGVDICSICGNDFTDTRLPPGTIISGFQLENEIGRGSMGTVYRAKQLNLERFVALKVLSEEFARDIDFVDSFFNEARAAARLSHPNIVQAFDAGAAADGIYYLAMELIEGETLKRRISRDGLMDIPAALSIALEIADALRYAWDKEHLLHGDLKPENIILNSSGSPKISDLGLTKRAVGESGRITGNTSPYYTPPEYINGDSASVGTKSDIYSFGVLLYHMLCGIPPFRAEDESAILKMHLYEKPAMLNEKNSDISLPLAAFVNNLLEKYPESRPDSWNEVIDGLKNLSTRDTKQATAIPKRKTKGKITTKKLKSSKTKKNIPRDGIPVPSPKKAREEPDTLEQSRQKTPGLKTALYALIIVAVAIIGALLFLLSQENFNLFRKKTKITSWDKIKTEIQFLDNKTASIKIKEFLEKSAGNAPKEAKTTLLKLNKALEQAKQNKKLYKEFAEKLKALIISLKREKTDSSNSPDLKKLQLKIKKLLLEAEKEHIPPPWFDENDKGRLNEALNKITSVISARHKAVLEKRKLEKKRLRRIAENKKRKKELEKQRRKDRIRNRMIDSYYSIIIDFIKNPDSVTKPSILSDSFLDWMKKYSKYPDTIWHKKAAFMAEQFKDSIPIVPVFIKNQKLIKECPVPFRKIPEEYKIDTIDEKSIRFSMRDGKVILGKILKWDKFTPQATLKLLESTLLDKKIFSQLPALDKHSLLIFLLMNRKFDSFEEILHSAELKDSENTKMWEETAEDFKTAFSEKKAVTLWRDAMEKIKNKDYLQASKNISEISSTYHDTDFFRRNRKKLKSQLDRFRQSSPSAQALNLISVSNRAFTENYKVSSIINPVMTAWSRYAEIESIPLEIKEKLSLNRKNALAILNSVVSINSVNDARMPFSEKFIMSGEALIFEKFLLKYDVFRNEDPIIPFITLGAYLDAGDWNRASRIVSTENFSPEFLLKDLGPLNEWAPNLLYSYAFAKTVYGTYPERLKLLDSLILLSQKTVDLPVKLNSATKAARYAVDISRPEAFKKIKENVKNLASLKNKRFRFELLSLVSLLNTPAGISKAQEKLRELNKDFPGEKYRPDLNYCSNSIKIINTPDSEKIKSYIAALSGLKPNEPELCAEFLCDVATAGILAKEPFPISAAKNIHEFIKDRVPAGVKSSTLWRKVALFNISTSADIENFQNGLNVALEDFRIASLKAYPVLFNLYIALEIIKGKRNAEELKTIYNKFFDKCHLASEHILRCPAIITAPEPGKIIDALLNDGRTEEAFCAFILSLSSKAKDENFFHSYMNKFRGKILLQEKLLLNKLKGLRENP